MAPRKPNKKYYFTVEGETEHWYLKWLQNQINQSVVAKCTASIDAPIQRDPLKRAKSLTILGKTEITHIFDYESDEDVHTVQFFDTLDAMKKSEGLGKQIKYCLGYSNLTFELWIALHRADCKGALIHRKNYLKPINDAFDEQFENLKEYKHENNFKRILGKLNLEDVKSAIYRAKRIMESNKTNGYILHNYRKFEYFKENPSLSIWESIEKILADCGLM